MIKTHRKILLLGSEYTELITQRCNVRFFSDGSVRLDYRDGEQVEYSDVDVYFVADVDGEPHLVNADPKAE